MERLNVAFLCAERDQEARSEFEPYLKLLEIDKPWLILEYCTIEHLSELALRKLLEKTDLFLFGASTDLLLGALKHEGVFRRIMDFHQIGRLTAVALILRSCNIKGSVFKNAELIPPSLEPANSPNWRTKDDAYQSFQTALKPILEKARDKKESLEKSWQEAKTIHREDGYGAFLRQYPRSRYSREAQKLRNEISEEAFWRQAEKQNTAHSYFYYLCNAPLQKNRLEAARRISEIEDDEENNWNEAESNDALELYIRYRALFPKGKHRETAETAITEQLKNIVPLERAYKGGLSSNFLTHLAYIRLHGSEIFSLSAYLPYCWNLRNHLEKLLNKVHFRRWSYPIYTFVLLFLLILLMPFSIVPFGNERMLTSRFLYSIFLLVIGIMVLYRIYLSHLHLEYDIRKLEDGLLMLKRGGILLRVAFITNDVKALREILILFTRIERLMQEAEAKHFFHYLLNDKRIEPLIGEEQQAAA